MEAFHASANMSYAYLITIQICLDDLICQTILLTIIIVLVGTLLTVMDEHFS